MKINFRFKFIAFGAIILLVGIFLPRVGWSSGFYALRAHGLALVFVITSKQGDHEACPG